MNELEIGVAVAFAAGVLSFLSPCVLPLVPSYLSFVSGVGIEELEEGGGDVKRVALTHSLFFVLGFSLIFLALGASATFVGRLMREYQVWIARVGGLLIIFFGLYLVGLRPFKGMARERRIHLRDKPLGYLGSTLVGITFGAGWTPCIGPILGSILMYTSARSSLGQGLLLLFAYSMGLAVPFLLAAVAVERFLEWFKRFRRYIPLTTRIAGGVLVAVGLLLVSGYFSMLAEWLQRLTPQVLQDRL
jgi:cytochrome c-type biogenesis protein